MRYWIRIFRDDEYYSTMVPDLPGCVAAGDSVEQVQDLLAEAISMHLDDMRKSGQTIPTATARMAVDVADLEDGEMYAWVDVKLPRTKAARKHRVAG